MIASNTAAAAAEADDSLNPIIVPLYHELVLPPNATSQEVLVKDHRTYPFWIVGIHQSQAHFGRHSAFLNVARDQVADVYNLVLRPLIGRGLTVMIAKANVGSHPDTLSTAIINLENRLGLTPISLLQDIETELSRINGLRLKTSPESSAVKLSGSSYLSVTKDLSQYNIDDMHRHQLRELQLGTLIGLPDDGVWQRSNAQQTYMLMPRDRAIAIRNGLIQAGIDADVGSAGGSNLYIPDYAEKGDEPGRSNFIRITQTRISEANRYIAQTHPDLLPSVNGRIVYNAGGEDFLLASSLRFPLTHRTSATVRLRLLEEAGMHATLLSSPNPMQYTVAIPFHQPLTTITNIGFVIESFGLLTDERAPFSPTIREYTPHFTSLLDRLANGWKLEQQEIDGHLKREFRLYADEITVNTIATALNDAGVAALPIQELGFTIHEADFTDRKFYVSIPERQSDNSSNLGRINERTITHASRILQTARLNRLYGVQPGSQGWYVNTTTNSFEIPLMPPSGDTTVGKEQRDLYERAFNAQRIANRFDPETGIFSIHNVFITDRLVEDVNNRIHQIPPDNLVGPTRDLAFQMARRSAQQQQYATNIPA